MSQFIESLAYQDGDYPLIKWHQKRVNETFKEFFSDTKPFDLNSILPSPRSNGLQKIRLVYDQKSTQVEVIPYQKKKISGLIMIEANDINYAFKCADRSSLESLFEKRGASDDILIIKNGYITDSYYANVCFWDGVKWYTPTTYLLNGVRRQYLLDKKLLEERLIKASDIKHYQKISLFNALIDHRDLQLSINQIINI